MFDPSGYPALVADFSHWQGRIDWPAVAVSGLCSVAVIKATEGANGVDPRFDDNRRGAIDNGIRWLPYAFLSAEAPELQARHFLDVTGIDGIPAALDWERSGVPARVMEAFGTVIADATGRLPLAYYGLYPPDAVTDTIATWPRWLPEYAAAPRLPPWDGTTDDWSSVWLLWQYTAKGRIPGVPGPVDRSRIACPIDDFLAWYDTGQLPAVIPAIPAA